MGAFNIPFVQPTFPTSNSDGSFNWQNFLVSNEQLIANTFLANQAITSPRASSVQILPNGGIAAAGGGAGITSSSIFGGSFNWLWLVILAVVFILILKK